MKAFGKSLKQYTTLNALPVGISGDNVRSHRKFIDKHGLNILLLADPQKTVVRKYSGTLLGWAKRKSFLIDPLGKLRKIYDSVNPKNHAQEVLRDLEGLTEPEQTLGKLESSKFSRDEAFQQDYLTTRKPMLLDVLSGVLPMRDEVR